MGCHAMPEVIKQVTKKNSCGVLRHKTRKKTSINQTSLVCCKTFSWVIDCLFT